VPIKEIPLLVNGNLFRGPAVLCCFKNKTNIYSFLLGFSDTLRVLYYEKNEKCCRPKNKLFAVFFFLFAITPVGEVEYF
jgi:hypothetical protein